MNIDFHVHGALSKKLTFDLCLFRRTLEAAREAGVHALALTDHAGTPNARRVHYALDQEFDYVGPHYLADGVRLLPGLEVSVQEGPHLLVIGSRDVMAIYRQRLHRSLDSRNTLPAQAFFDIQQDLETLTIFAHPFRGRRGITRVSPHLYPQVDGIGLNARDLHFHGAPIRGRTEVFARHHRLPVVAGSDTHHFHQVGSVYTQFCTAFDSVADLKSMIAGGTYKIRINQHLGDKVAAARRAKKALKEAGRSAT